MEKKRILCFGDSLTWGFDPDKRIRFGEEDRWTAVMAKDLGEGFTVIEEGQNGRTIAVDDPSEGEKNGLKYIRPCLESQSPLDLVIIMLGCNDCKRKFSFSAMDIAGEMQIFLEKVLAYNRFRQEDRFKVLLLSPPHVTEEIRDSWLGDSYGFENARKLSMELSPWYKELADAYGCAFLDTAAHVKASPVDGIHMDAENHRILGHLLAEEVRRLI